MKNITCFNEDAHRLDEYLDENEINYKSYILDHSSVFVFLDDGAELYSDRNVWRAVGFEPKYKDDTIIKDHIEDIADYILLKYKNKREG